MLKNEDFLEASVYVRILEKRMLSGSGVNRIVDAPGTAEALRLISQNSEYDFGALKRTGDYEYALRDGLKKTYELMYRLSASKVVVDIPASKYVFHNLKAALKSKYLGQDFSYLYSDIPDGLDMSDVVSFIHNGEKRDELPEYVSNALDEAMSAFEESGDPQDIDIILDRHMFAYMLSLCEKLGNDFITEYVRISIDFQNIKTLMRVKNMQKGSRFLNQSLIPGGMTGVDFFLEHYDKAPDKMAAIFYYKYFGNVMGGGMEQYGRSGNYSGLEKLCDDYLVEYVKKAKYVAFGPEVLFAYIVSKENEIRQIRIIVTCKNNGIQADALRERLRENYA